MRILPVRAGGRHRYAGSPVGFDVDDRPVPGSCRPDPEARRPTRMADHGPVPSDRQLVDAARAGSDRAWRELVHRHSAAIRAVADATGRLAPARTAHAAWKRVHREILGEVAGREGPVRAVRARALAAIVDGTYAPVAAGEPLPPPMATGAGVPTIDAVDRSAGAVVSSAGAPAPTQAELVRLAAAFGSLPDDWQTVLWHSWVDLEPAAIVASHLGRSVAATRALAVVADAGLCEAFLAAEPAVGVRPSCRDIVPLLGGARRSTLSATHERIVEAHLGGQTRHGDPTPCAACGRRLRIVGDLAALVPRAVVPGITGLDVTRYRSLVGAGTDVVGADASTEQRTEQVSQLTRLGAVAAVVVTLLAATFFIRAPDLQRRIADLAEAAPPTVAPPGSDTVGDPTVGDPTVGDPTDGDPTDGAGRDEPADRIELHFAGAPHGGTSDPSGSALDVRLELSAPSPVFAGG